MLTVLPQSITVIRACSCHPHCQLIWRQWWQWVFLPLLLSLSIKFFSHYIFLLNFYSVGCDGHPPLVNTGNKVLLLLSPLAPHLQKVMTVSFPHFFIVSLTIQYCYSVDTWTIINSQNMSITPRKWLECLHKIIPQGQWSPSTKTLCTMWQNSLHRVLQFKKAFCRLVKAGFSPQKF